jgi:hypothetical protein
MTKSNLTFVLALTAAGLAFAALLITYLRGGQMRFGLIAAGVFLIVFGIGARRRQV